MNERDTMRWVWRGSALAVLVIGWVFIAWQNHFHISAPLVFVCLGYLAVVATVYNLWRTGAAAVASAEDEGDSTWAKPAGALGELEREKRTLLKAIKEAEFDHQMGKLSQRDVDDMIRTYRARAIEVIKEIDRLGLGQGAAGTTREQIMREVRARLELEAKSQRKVEPKAEPKQAARPEAGDAAKAGQNSQGGRPGKGKKRPGKDANPTADVRAAATDGGRAAAADVAVTASASAAAATHANGDEAREPVHPAAAQAAAAAQATLDDEALDADSTTTVEPKRDDPAKEATP